MKINQALIYAVDEPASQRNLELNKLKNLLAKLFVINFKHYKRYHKLYIR